ncbi:hypothetical protein [Sciscionella sediminilitoris]|uniref:hypothetical protein n=1 Tax=Sciscionella sediminilitoris TaxID=1445613 RepID=UPI0004DF64EE|nr:hypothetical protein [Sciscionella sp. SE31]
MPVQNTPKRPASKVTAAGIAAALAGPAAMWIANTIHLADPTAQTAVRAVVTLAITGALAFLAGWAKREHIITDDQFRDFTAETEPPEPTARPRTNQYNNLVPKAVAASTRAPDQPS